MPAPPSFHYFGQTPQLDGLYSAVVVERFANGVSIIIAASLGRRRKRDAGAIGELARRQEKFPCQAVRS
jgi:hypothetical protein